MRQGLACEFKLANDCCLRLTAQEWRRFFCFPTKFNIVLNNSDLVTSITDWTSKSRNPQDTGVETQWFLNSSVPSNYSVRREIGLVGLSL